MAKKKKILLVDDDPMMRWTLTTALQEWGYETGTAASAAEALERFARVQPHIILLDINLPDGSGLELLQYIKQQQPAPAVIMMTGDVVVENTIAAWRGGADDFIGKPIRLDELHLALTHAERATRRSFARPQLPRLLIVADAPPQAEHLQVALGLSQVDITVATTPAELQRAIQAEHDLILVDVAAAELRGILATLRASPPHADVPILVEISRVGPEPELAGVLPQYRAMPCSPPELVALARRRLTALSTLSVLAHRHDLRGHKL